MSGKLRSVALAAGFFSVLSTAHAAGLRTHVSNNGNDSNTAFSCDSSHPCRTLSAALSVTTAGGEILAVDSSGYGKVVIDRSVSIIAAPGVFAGIGVGAGGNATGVEIAAGGVNVVLRGLTISGQGGTYGIRMTNGASLAVEECVISGFAGAFQYGLRVAAPASVRVTDTTIRDNNRGMVVDGGARATVFRSAFVDNASVGLSVWGNTAGVTSMLHVAESLVTGSTWGLGADAVTNPTAAAVLTILRTTIAANGYGVYSTTSVGGVASVTVAKSTVTGNSVGLYKNAVAGGFPYMRSNGNNAVTDNGSDVLPGLPDGLPPI